MDARDRFSLICLSGSFLAGISVFLCFFLFGLFEINNVVFAVFLCLIVPSIISVAK